MTGYTRKDTTNNIADGNVINAADLDNEFDGVQAAFHASTGHTHDGTAAEGAAITKIGPVQDVVVSISSMSPKTTNTIDLGTSALKYKDAFFAGNETVGGTLAVTGVATLTAQPVLSSLTASSAVATDASKGLVSVTNTGTGNNVLATSPTLVTPILGTPTSATLTNATGLPISTGVAGLGTGVATALAVNIGSAGAPVVFNGALGTPSSGTVTNLTGTASININGTVGATTPTTGAFTTVSATGAIKSTGANLANEASAAKLSQEGVATSRVSAYGNDASTQGALQIRTVSSDGTASTIPATFSSTGLAVTGTLSATGAVTLSGGTANGVAYLDGSKVLTTGSALTFDGVNLTQVAGTPVFTVFETASGNNNRFILTQSSGLITYNLTYSSPTTNAHVFQIGGGEQMRLTSTGLGIGTSSPAVKLDITGNDRLVRLNATSSNALIRYSLSGVAKFSEGLNDPSGWILYDDAASAYRLLVDYSGNLGVGSVSPGAKLDVAGNALLSGSSGYKYLYFNTSVEGATVRGARIGKNYDSTFDLGIWASTHSAGNATATVFYRDLTTESMRLDSSGNLGIGTSSPAYKLQVIGTGQVSVSAAGTQQVLQLNNSDTTVGTQAVKLAFSSNGVTKASINAAVYNNDYMTFNVGSDTERMRLDASGNLGLGVTPSAWTFSGVAALQIKNAGFWGYLNRATVTANGFVNSAGAYTYIANGFATTYEQDSGKHIWYNAPSGTAGNAITFTQAMTLDASGNLFVGCTSNVTNGGFRFNPASGDGYIDLGHITGTASGSVYQQYVYAGSPIGSITQNGTTGVLYNITSDQRLKENIQDAAPASALIDSLQVRQFDWKSDGSHQRYGFVAQELFTVAPEAVHAPADPDEMMAVDYSKLVPLLVKELQSLRARVAQLESKP